MHNKTELKVETKESVALAIAHDIASKENLFSQSKNYRKEFLDLYAECLTATSNQREIN